MEQLCSGILGGSGGFLRPVERRAASAEAGLTPAELLVGSAHQHWLELLGYQRFQRN